MADSTFVTYGDVLPRVGIEAVAKMLTRIEPITVLEPWALVTPLPKNKGETIKWRRIRPLVVSTTNLTEGVTPPSEQLVYEDVVTVIAQFGGWIQITDKVTDLHEDRVLDDAMTALADQAASVKEAVIWGILRGGTNVFYSNGVARSSVNTPIDLDLVNAAVNLLKRNHAKKLTERMKAGPNIATEPVNSSYVAFSHIDLETDIRDMDGFVPVEKYASGQALDPEWEIGKVNEVRFILSPQLSAFADAGGATSVMRSTSGTNADVYPVVIIGKEAFGVVPLKGISSVEMAVKNPKMGEPGDPLGQRGHVSWKIWYQAVRLNELWMVRLEVAATALS
jgi:N4-gp56 family major capsid protein